jgi:pimeloyl-ACP methyl ester carboxylesterase
VARATIVGHSFGAAVAAALAVREPARVARLVLVAPAANTASLYRIDHWLAAPTFGALAGVAMLGALGGALVVPPLRGRIAGAAGIDERYLGLAGRRLLSPATWRAFAFEQRALVAELPALERRLPEITAPTTIVGGTADRVVPSASIKQLATQIPSAELRWLPDAGHLVPQQRGSALAEIVLEAIPSPAVARARPA